jgi:hypothetical protein
VELRYLYVGTSDTERDLAAWLAVPGAAMRWRFRHFGADVAAVDLGSAPVVLLADHRPAGTVLPIYAVDSLDGLLDTLGGQGWTIEARALGTPEGPAALLRDASGNELALLRVDSPTAMEQAYAAPANEHAVRPGPDV